MMQRVLAKKTAEMANIADKVREKATPIIIGMKMAEDQNKREQAQRLMYEE